ncbi:tyrosine-type recombinase/integrase [Halorhodospira halochloris]|uniref:tyrosine-type recombinase/integrase n=1 Tax=Halorhodospira halochloris TaxID=1052 RepID=UPI001EE989E9|nr:integrase arm-type DNA-binding domain-containing protein [Halorhodospira halochloris]MCG5531329.1 tyrosine-type recombinase/integrase [Halorhodospira halochloris]
MALTDKRISQACPKQKRYKLFDCRGLYIIVAPSGGKWWRLRYRLAGKERHLSLGKYPQIRLKQAREKRSEIEALLAAGIDPQQRPARSETVADLVEEWLTSQKTNLSTATLRLAKRRLEKWVLPHIGNHSPQDLNPPELLRLLRRMESQGKYHTAHRVRQRLSQIFRYAIVTGRMERDPAADLKGALAVAPTQHRAAITQPSEVADLLDDIDSFQGRPATLAALNLLALTFVRPGELRLACWSEIDLEQGIWRIPGKRMKMRRDHLVPLSNQAVDWLRWIKEVGGYRDYVFESSRGGKPIGVNTINQALRSLGYTKDQMTAHGFRAMASTLLHELGWQPELIELQLAHANKNKVSAAYNRSARLAERVKMMQSWADHLAILRCRNTNVVAMHGGHI